MTGGQLKERRGYNHGTPDDLSGVPVPNNRLSMRQIKEGMRLHFECGRSKREVARAMNPPATAVWEYLQRAKRAELAFERARGLDDAALEALLFPPVPPSRCPRPMPNWPLVHRELGRTNGI